MTSTSTHRQPLSRRARLTLATAVVVALVLDFVFFTGYYASDDIQYITAGKMLFESGELPPGIGGLRLGMAIPTGLAYSIFGDSIAAAAWLHVLYHLVLVLLAFAIGRRVHDERVGLVAAVLAAINPLYYLFAGAVLPDNATSVWLGLTLLLLLRARDLQTSGLLGGRQALLRYGVIGFVLGVAYSTKETALIMVVPAAICTIAAAPRLRDPVWVRNGAFMAGGLVAFLILEMLIIRATSGASVMRFAIGQDEGAATHVVQFFEKQGGTNPLERLWFAIVEQLPLVAPLTLWPLLLAAVAYVVVPRRNLHLMIFFWWPLVYLTIGTISFTSYAPPPIQARYYAIVMLPAVVMLAAALAEIARRWVAWQRLPERVRGNALLAGIALLVVVSLCEIVMNLPSAGNIYGARTVRQLTRAYEVARDQYPQYPITFNQRYRAKMQLLLTDTPDVHVDVEASPAPPFLYIDDDGTADEADRAWMRDYEVTLLRTVPTLPGRRAELGDAIGRMFALSPTEVEPSGGASILLVTSRAHPPACADIGDRTPWHVPRGQDTGAQSLEAGDLVAWHQRHPFSVEIPASPAGALPDPHRLPRDTNHVSASLDLRLVRSERTASALVSVTLYGLASGERFVASTQEVTLRAGDPPVPVRLEVTSPETLIDYRLAAVVLPQLSTGALYFGDPCVDVATMASPEKAPHAVLTRRRWVAMHGEEPTMPFADGDVAVLDSDMTVQLFDRAKRPGNPSGSPLAKLPTGTRYLQVAFDARLLQGDGAQLTVDLYGGLGGTRWASSTMNLPLGRTDRVTPLTIALATAEPMSTFRVRIRARPSTEGPGALYLGSPRLEALATPPAGVPIAQPKDTRDRD